MMSGLTILLQQKKAVAGLIIIVALCLMAIFAPVIAPGAPSARVGRSHQPPTVEHVFGTTKMGRDEDPLAVLDSRLRVRDGRGGRIAGLRVVDAGAMPTITSGNTNSPTLMLAEKAAAWIRADQAAASESAVLGEAVTA